MNSEINYIDEIYNILKNSNKKWIFVNNIYKKLISNIDKSLVNNDFQKLFLLNLMIIKYYHKDVNVIYNSDGGFAYIVLGNSDVEVEDEEEEEQEEEEQEEKEQVEEEDQEINRNIFVTCPECSDDEEENNDEDYNPEDDETDDDSSIEYNNDDEELLYLLTKDDIIDYAIDNCNNLEIMSFILKYREDDNNIMHILFANKKNKEIEKLLNSESINLLIEENNDGKCPIDYMNNTILKKIMKECIKNNNLLNNDVYDLYGYYYELKTNISYLSISFSCIIFFLFMEWINKN